MHGRLALALLLVLPLLAPSAASGAVPPDRQIRKVEAIATSAGALVRVTLRAPLKGPLRVGFERSDGESGSTRRSAVVRGRRRTDFLFAGDARNLARVIVRTGPRGDRATLQLPRVTDDCAALARLARKLRPLRRGRPAVRARLRAIARRMGTCGTAVVPIDPPGAPAPAPAPGFTPPAARFAPERGLTPEDPLSAGADVVFRDASVGTDLVDWAWDFDDGTTASGTLIHHTFAQPGRYSVLLTVRNTRGNVSAFGHELFVRGPGTATITGDPIPCPDPGETEAVTVRVRVPSWAKLPAKVSYTFAETCGAGVSDARDLAITPGNAGNHKGAWGRDESTLRFTFDITSGMAPPATVAPGVTASWS